MTTKININKDYYGYIYKTKNLLNNKIYIGQTTRSSKHHNEYLGSGLIIQRAIKKYGKKNFENEIIELCYSKEQLDLVEIKYIELFQSKNPIFGYNIREGGSRGKHSNETKKKIGIKSKERVHPSWTIEQRKNLSNIKMHHEVTNSTRIKISNKLKNRVVPDEIGQKISKVLKANYFNGLIPWNKGLTKENDIRLKKISKKLLGRPSKLKGIPKSENHKKNMRKAKEKTNFYK